MGLFDQLLQVGGKVSSLEQGLSLASGDPIVSAVKGALNILPEGDLKRWLSASPKKLFKMVWEAVAGRKYTKNEYRLVEIYIDNMLPDTPVDSITNTNQVPDDQVEMVAQLLTILFGVRITTRDDVNALQAGMAAYKSRPDKSDIPDAAIKRAVMLKQTFFPDNMYNRSKWDISKFEQYPLVAPIPGRAFGTLYNGELPGGAIAKNGVIPADAALKQVLSSTVPTTGDELDDAIATTGGNTTLIVGAAAALVIGYLVLRKKKGRR